MAPRKREATAHLTIYRIRAVVDGEPVVSPHQALDEELRLQARKVLKHDLLEGALFVAPRIPIEIRWLDFLESGFGPLDDMTATRPPGALLVVRRKDKGAPWFAIPFGSGRFLLDQNKTQAMFGLKAALNILYPVGVVATAEEPRRVDRIRSVNFKSLGGTGLHTIRQSPQDALLEDFEVDTRGDLLRSVVGRPSDVAKWGRAIVGGDGVHLKRPTSFSDLPRVLADLEDTAERPDYLETLPWLDDIQPVDDPLQEETVWTYVARRIQLGELDGLSLCPPEIVEWERVERFGVPRVIAEPSELVGLTDVSGHLKPSWRNESLPSFLERLREWRLETIDANGELVKGWNFKRCIAGEVEISGTTYSVFDGRIYKIASNLLDEVKAELSEIGESDIGLPAYNGERKELTYNTTASKQCGGILMDQKTVKLERKTSPVEICDILAPTGEMVHVKKGRSSSELSHLFSQGAIAGQLLLESAKFHAKAVGVANSAAPGGTAPKAESPIRAGSPFAKVTTFGIIRKWNGQSLHDGLPFFSRLNLAQRAQELRRLGFRVRAIRIAVK